MAKLNLGDTDSADEDEVPEARSGRSERPKPAAKPTPRGQVTGKEKLQPYITKDVAEAARNAVVATTPFKGGYQSLSDLIEDAIAEKVRRLERKFNEGEPFPERPQKKLKTGRPTGT